MLQSYAVVVDHENCWCYNPEDKTMNTSKLRRIRNPVELLLSSFQLVILPVHTENIT
jgi:hypothetical protein